MRLRAPLAPGSTVGILGGGQLGRMLALAAGQLGLKCHIFAPEEDSPAFQVSAAHMVAGYHDFAAHTNLYYEFLQQTVQDLVGLGYGSGSVRILEFGYIAN